jgi:alkanesulfonate monooxygenase SsuD/methylene tetrahydromethanopterin reductase-like flavin-dependent oxidoreductase (luciferase family)
MTRCVIGEPARQVRNRPAGALIGTVEEVADRLRDLEAAGVTRVFLQHLDHRDLDSVALMGRELAPAVA